MSTIYQCQNPGCTLGSRQDPGYFTGGMTADGRNRLDGTPVEKMEEGKDFGDGVCPACGEPAVATDEKFKPDVGEDPLAHLHAKVAAGVAAGELPVEEAQQAFLELAEKEGVI